MTALQAHPAIRLPVGRLAPTVVGASGTAAAVLIGATALLRPADVATATVGACAVVLAVAGMYAILAAMRFRHLLTLTTAVMGLSMARLLASVALGVGWIFMASPPEGARPDKFVFAVAFLGTWLVVLGVETPLLRGAIRRLGDSLSSAATSGTAPASTPASADTLGLDSASRTNSASSSPMIGTPTGATR